MRLLACHFVAFSNVVFFKDAMIDCRVEENKMCVCAVYTTICNSNERY